MSNGSHIDEQVNLSGLQAPLVVLHTIRCAFAVNVFKGKPCAFFNHRACQLDNPAVVAER
jgi:hypothetical protein